MLKPSTSPWRRDSTNPASGKPGAVQYREYFEAKGHLNLPRQEPPRAGGKVLLLDLLGTVFHKLAELFGVASELFQKLLGMAKRLF
ncbi:hypothetical protein [Azospirillum sp. TSA6c]|uniref:hypothetical protein n=1 Tax=unclassified Azospirillum TaxID=2630922 RepID=UPI0011B825C0|nr:hypothetical protein [Azospirillum sp. TSA6c]